MKRSNALNDRFKNSAEYEEAYQNISTGIGNTIQNMVGALILIQHLKATENSSQAIQILHHTKEVLCATDEDVPDQDADAEDGQDVELTEPEDAQDTRIVSEGDCETKS